MRNVITLTAAAVLFIALAICSLTSQAGAAVVAADYYETTVLAASPEVYWRLGEAVIASPADNLGTQGAGADGVYGATTTLGNAGPLFDSTNTAAGFAAGVTTSSVTQSAFAFPTGSFSSEFWVNSSTTGVFQGLVSYNVPGGENNFTVFSDAADSLTFILSNSITATGIDIADGSWHHVATTWDFVTGSFEVYHDGAPAFSLGGYVTGLGRITGGDLVLGQEQDGTGASGSYTLDPNQAFTGFLDEFALYGTVLTPAEILLHFNVGVGNVLPPVPEPSTFLLLGLGAMGLVRHTRRHRRRA